MEKKYDYIIVGGGIIGLATAYKLALKENNKSILVLEKEKTLASHQTGNNSGVIHSGIYYTPGSLKAKNCINGRKQLIDFAQKHRISHEMCGKLIAAFKKSEVPTLEKIYRNGLENGLEDIKILSSEESRQYEPYVECIQSIFVPYAGIIDYRQVVETLAQEFLKINPNNQVLKLTKVTAIKSENEFKVIVTPQQEYSTKYAIFSAGLQADEMATLDGIDMNIQIVGFRGDYYNVINQGVKKVKGLIYPVPNTNLPFLGVHLTKMYDGSIEAGPNAVFSFKKEGYSRISFSIRDTIKAFTFIGLWKLFFGYWKIGLGEYKRAFSKKRFLKSLKKLVPDLKMEEITRGKSGVRAQALDNKGNLVDDFLIKKTPNSLHIINAPSPAATACLAIADEVVNRIFEK
ncbi:L-2-hydroxyglutarate oxidase [Patiriisocius sp. Uisw_017]|uniref:L-2-hydroxyglutarate oxidase n=1 Tax=Patiriisocius sp. Uisw_017 TaxID=3230968 RepID=UPI0039E79AF2